MENKYSRGKIYKIIDNTNGNIYIGSTIQDLNIRLNEHRRPCRNVSREIIKNGDYKIELIKNYPCINKFELEEEEAKYIREYKCINITIPHRTKKEWVETNKDKILEKGKKYRDNNKDKIKEKKKEYYQKNKVGINQKNKEYRNNNKDKLRKQKKEWYENNKDEVKQYQKEYQKEYNKKNKQKLVEKINCPICNSLISKRNIKQHQQTKKCISCKN